MTAVSDAVAVVAAEPTQLERFVRVLTRIELDPASLDQSTWAQKSACGTTYCFAGHTVVEDGIPIAWSSDGQAHFTTYGTGIDYEAQQILQLTDSEAHVLFYETASLDDLYEWSAEILDVRLGHLRALVAESKASALDQLLALRQ